MKFILPVLVLVASHSASAIILKTDPAPPEDDCGWMLSSLERAAAVELPPAVRHRLARAITTNPEHALLVLMALRAANPHSRDLVDLYERALERLVPTSDQRGDGSGNRPGSDVYIPRLHHQGGIKI